MKKVLVIGDSIIDEYFYGSVERISPEAPVPILDIEESGVSLGGALNVLLNIRSLLKSPKDIEIEYCGFIGKTSKPVLNKICKSFDYCAWSSPEMTKTRLVSQNQHLFRIDNFKWYNNDEILLLIEKIDFSKYDLVVVSDYDKGTISTEVWETIFSIKTRCLIDLKYINQDYFGVVTKDNFIFKCNAVEFDKNSEFLSRAKNLIVTMGRYGYQIRSGQNSENEQFGSLVKRNEIIDVTGAGDTFLSGMAVNYLERSKFSLYDMAAFGNKCAAQAVKRFGTIAVKREWLDE